MKNVDESDHHRDSEREYCPSNSPYVWTDDLKENERTILKTRCKRWDCPYCAPINREIHRIRIYHGTAKLQDAGHDISFVTLTSHEKLKTLESTYKVWKQAWTKLSTRYRRKIEKITSLPPVFVYIPETHKDGRLHIHGIFTGEISTRWWKDNSRQCGLGYMAKSNRLESAAQATNYCTKYLTKAIGQNVDIARFRRVNYSRTFPTNAMDMESSSWNILDSKQSIESLISDAWRHDKSVTLNKRIVEEIIYE